MTAFRAGRGFFETPHTAVYLVLTATLVVSGLCFVQSGTPSAPADLLFRYGAMYPQALPRQEYWRLIAHGFLHANFVHLTLNMLCLVLWGGHLEKRVGVLFFLIIYAGSMVSGAIVNDLSHSTPYIAVGASGAISGILGGLLCLWILGKIDLQANFFVISIGLNVAFAISNPRIGWVDHLAGFAAGLTTCALLDVAEKINRLWLRCKFPEFVKANMVAIIFGAGLLLWGNRPAVMAFNSAINSHALVPVAVYVALCLLMVKAADIVLSLQKGLAVTVLLLATANAALVLFGTVALASSLYPACTAHRFPIERLLDAACANPSVTVGLAAIGAFILTVALYAQELYRGIEDVGFVGASLRAERKRRQGI